MSVKETLKKFLYSSVTYFCKVKNSLIYTLIILMGLALIGITAIQGVWISKAISEQENEFTVRVNKALNDVNEKINDREANVYLDFNFGGTDSLMDDIMVIGDPAKVAFVPENIGEHEIRVISGDSDHAKFEYKITNDYTVNDSSNITVSIQSSADSVGNTRVELARIIQQLEPLKNLEHIEDIIDLKGLEDLELKVAQKMKVIESEVNSHEFEFLEDKMKFKFFHHFHEEKAVEDRIPLKELSGYIKEAFVNKGLGENYEFAVYDDGAETYISELSSANFENVPANFVFEKKLFPFDEGDSNFDLVMQLDNEGTFIWNEVKPMVGLSVLFTLLILFCFGYSLYFIFKQKKLSQVKDDFVNNMTHELKTPLATISLAADSIKHPQVINNKEEVMHFVTMIKNEEGRMNAQIEKVLEIASLDKGEFGLSKQEIDLVEVVESGIANVQLTLKESGGQLDFNSNVDSSMIMADPFHLENMVNNLLDNSIKYRSEHELSIFVDLQKVDDCLQLTFSDNGIGMNKKAKELAFDKFYRQESGNVHTVKGYGLGLTYVKKVVDQHKGSVALMNNDKQGLKVQIKLPIDGQ